MTISWRNFLLVAALAIAVGSCAEDTQVAATQVTSSTRTSQPTSSTTKPPVATTTTTKPAPTTSVVTVPPTTTAAAPEALPGWTLVGDGPSAQPGVSVRHVSETPWGLVAAGTVKGAAAFWLSQDGAAWDLVHQEPSPSIEDETSLSAIALTEEGVVAVGNLGGTPMAWASPDARTWTHSVIDEAKEAYVHGVAFHSGLLLAVGTLSTPDPDPSNAAAWTSLDGKSWQPVNHPGFEAAAMLDVAAGPEGFVIVGCGLQPAHPRAWTFQDGEWSMVDVYPGHAWAQVHRIGDGFLAFGDQDDAWFSEDGTEWHEVTDELGFSVSSSPFGDKMEIATNTDLTAVVSADGSHPLWITNDGSTWEQVGMSPWPVQLESFGDGFVAVGGQVWFWDPSSV